eukprot:TRINITY_DN4887_c0_g1_i1.p1 TRINITY_DN4887_c0_g1~~TRINITY_DN4887_c0_g1_i1.p1  ORF type:complete len:234 (+),score=30.95 TRINITY_DN4887_c0_g1_i1:33-704(+)
MDQAQAVVSSLFTTLKLVAYAPGELYEIYAKFFELANVNAACSSPVFNKLIVEWDSEPLESNIQKSASLVVVCSMLHPLVSFALLSFVFFISLLFIRKLLLCLNPCRSRSKKEPSFVLASREGSKGKEKVFLWIDERGIFYSLANGKSKPDVAQKEKPDRLFAFATVYSWDFDKEKNLFMLRDRSGPSEIVEKFFCDDKEQLFLVYSQLDQIVNSLSPKVSRR